MSTNSTPGRRARMATTGRFVKPQESMSQERLDTIRARLGSVEFPDNEHLTVTNSQEKLVCWVEYSPLDGSIVSGELVATVHAGPRAAEMFAHAPQDVTDLLAEVERLRALTTVTDDLVERVARALCNMHSDPWTWDEVTEIRRAYWRKDARVILEAVFGTGEKA